MPVCGVDASHRLDEWWRRNELGRWYQCLDCGSTVLSPSFRYRLLVMSLRLHRRGRRVARLIAWTSATLAGSKAARSAARPVSDRVGWAANHLLTRSMRRMASRRPARPQLR